VKVVVTGGAGFIGANLLAHIGRHHSDWELVALDDLSSGFRSNLTACPQARLLEGSILDENVLEAAFDGADAVVHLAARPSVPRSIADPVTAHEVNATGTMRVLEAARRAGGPHVIVASSSSVYGANPTLPKVETLAARPISPYAASKLATESYTLAWGHSYDLPVLAFRFFNVFGPLQAAGHAYAAAIPTFVAAALDGRPIPVHGDGLQSRDFTFVGTVAEVIRRVIDDRVTSTEPVNLAFGSNITLLEVIAELSTIFGRDLPIDHQPSRPGDVRHSQADNSLLRSLIQGVEPVEFADGLRQTVEWFRTIPTD
jgi:UDP-glucose 4-epimerase